MKTLLSFAAVTLVILLSSFSIDTQQQLNRQLMTGHFSAFELQRNNQGVALSWTVSDQSITSFAVERSEDGATFHTACALTARNAAVFQDLQLISGAYQYRIAAIHADGSVEYSPVREVRI